MAWWNVAALLMLLCVGQTDCEQPHAHFSSSTTINTVVQDSETGRIYLGAVNAIYQLNSRLQKESVATVGPKKDFPTCTPPITALCVEAKDTDNINKLLLVNRAHGSLVVCGSIFRGICSLHNLSSVEQQLYFSDTKGEKTYVTTSAESISVVGVISNITKDGKTHSVFYVGQGYGNSDSLKLVSTRLLETSKDSEWEIFENMVETSTVQMGSLKRFIHNFRYAFRENGYIYFLFSRTLGTPDSRNYSFVARLCETDVNYFSYVELQLNCSMNGENTYNKIQAAYLASPGPVLADVLKAKGQLETGEKVLFAVFGSDDGSSSALCMYPLSSINRQIGTVINSCYRAEVLPNKNPKAVYSPYATSSKPEEMCKNPIVNGLERYPCGDEFLPSPLVSKAEYALSTQLAYTRKSNLTSVAVTVVNEHTVAFLGTSHGEVFKVHLTNSSDAYGKIPGDVADGPVNKNMFFDSSKNYVYVTTAKEITKIPVQACELKTECSSCMAQRDPYCGWCVLEGRCTTKQNCSQRAEKNAWLWSPNQKCVTIEAFNPPSISRKKNMQVKIYVPTLPTINEKLDCVFGDYKSDAVMDNNGQVTCLLPDVEKIPPTPEDKDYVALPVKLTLNDKIELTSSEYKFYDCAAVVKEATSIPCIACVTSKWRCQWNLEHHTCVDEDELPVTESIIKPTQDARCPRFENPNPNLIPVGFKSPIVFDGTNLETYTGRSFQIGTQLMKEFGDVTADDSKFRFDGYEFSYDKNPEVNVTFYVNDKLTKKKVDCTLQVVLYNCSVGRKDCSLCKNADPKYNCVWCGSTQSCIYNKLCTKEVQTCPAPTITDIVPRYGPTSGDILVTIKGFNLGIKKEDIKSITVAEVPCVHQVDRYTVSTGVVCKIGPGSREGVAVVEVEGSKFGTSPVVFEYRDPKPTKIEPTNGPAGGGTIINISGYYLDTASKEDISITVGGVPCQVLDFGPTITCKTGAYTGLQVPSKPLPVIVKYGETTSKEVTESKFTYSPNPKVLKYEPSKSFFWGGRKIVVEGTGFSQLQKVFMKVLPSGDEFNQQPSNPAEFVQEVHYRNDTILEFHSPSIQNVSKDLSLMTVLELDSIQENLEEFEYIPNPEFDPLDDNSISPGRIKIVSGRGLDKAMTAQEAEAYVGNERCVVTFLSEDKLYVEAPQKRPTASSMESRSESSSDDMDLLIKFGNGKSVVGRVHYDKAIDAPLYIIIPAVILPMLLFIAISVYCYRRKSQQAEREYEKLRHQLESLEESVRDRCKKEFTDLMIEMEDHTSDLSEARIPFLDYKNYTDRVFFLPSKDGVNDVMITGKLDIPGNRRAIVDQALNQFSNLLNSKTFLINFIRTLESRQEFNARSKVYFASLLTVALHGKLEYYTDIMRTLLLELMDSYVHSKNPKLMLRRSETVVERMLCNWMSICLYQFLKDSAGEPLYKLFKAIKHQVEKGPVDAKLKKAKYTLNDTGLLGDDVEYCVLTLQVLVHGEGPDVTPVKVLNCDTIYQVKEKIIEQVYRNLPYSQRPKVDSVALEWRPGSTGQILSDLDLTSQKEGRWKRLNTLAHYNVRDNATLVLSKVLHTQQSFDQHQDNHEERSALLEDDKVFHLVRPAEELDERKSKRGSMKEKPPVKNITEIYLTRLFSMKGTLQQFVDDFFRSVLCSGAAVPPAVKYFFDFLDEQAHKHDNVDEETIHIWKTNSLPLRFWVNILKNPHFIFDVHVSEVVDSSLSVIAQTFMDACTKSEHKLTTESPSNKLLYAKEIPTYKKMVEEYYRGIRQMVPVSDQDMNTHLAEVSRSHTDKLNTQVALHQLYQYASKYYDGIISSLEDDPAAQNKQLTLRLQQIAAALEKKVTDL